MPAAPLVSVLLPVYQAEATLPACLASLERQTLTDWECVIVDDGSTDGTAHCAARFVGREPRARVLRRDHHGLVETLNAGLEACSGTFIARMDADDLMHRERLRLQVDHLRRHPDEAGVGCHVRIFPRDSMRDGLRAYERWLGSIDDAARVRAERFIESPVAHPTWLVRREILTSYGYRDVGWPEDYDFLLRLHQDGHAFGIVPRRLVSWREHPNRLTHTAAAYEIEQFPLLKAAFLRQGFLADRKTYVLWGYGHTGKILRRALIAHDREPSHIVEVHPGRLGQRIHGAPVISPDDLADHPGERIVTSVAGAGPRGEVRAALARMGFVELRDFVCAA
ncbi:MAG: glycosyltransferase family 2 protein [Candidatus Binatia bacterium]|nr:glycosyltransferase family 2 protein [Candidatus Binatia bacterium]